MKAVLISIRPKWCAKITSGDKSIEVRKTRPKLETPFKCYIYCTLPRYPHEDFIETDYPKPQFYGGGKVIGEFVCDQITEIWKRGIPENFDYCYLSLKEWGNDDVAIEINDVAASCLPKDQLNSYGAKVPLLYGWHISNLKIYDKPRELREFTGLRQTKFGAEPVPITRPPQSWCYVEDM